MTIIINKILFIYDYSRICSLIQQLENIQKLIKFYYFYKIHKY